MLKLVFFWVFIVVLKVKVDNVVVGGYFVKDFFLKSVDSMFVIWEVF